MGLGGRATEGRSPTHGWAGLDGLPEEQLRGLRPIRGLPMLVTLSVHFPPDIAVQGKACPPHHTVMIPSVWYRAMNTLWGAGAYGSPATNPDMVARVARLVCFLDDLGLTDGERQVLLATADDGSIVALVAARIDVWRRT